MIIAFAGPATLIFVATFIYPIIRTIVMSFFSIQEITDATDKWKFNGIGNYISLMETPLYRTSWINLFKIFIIGGVITLGASLLLAVILKSGVHGKRFFQAAIYLPNVISAVAMATMWIQYVFNSSYGFLTNLFKALHLDFLADVQWLDADHKFWALLISYCFGMIGHFMLIWELSLIHIYIFWNYTLQIFRLLYILCDRRNTFTSNIRGERCLILHDTKQIKFLTAGRCV